MRIGQLARRLGIPPNEILGFLTSVNIEAEAGANSRLASDVVERVVNHFAPGKLSEILGLPTETVPEQLVETPVAAAPEISEIVEEQPVVSTEEQPATETEQDPDLPVEVIRVSKVELQGLKVLGKIELPEAKKKAETVADSEEQPEQSSLRPPRKEYQRRNDRREREWKNPLEQKREQEAREQEQKKQQSAERAKEKRTSHYHSKVKSVPTKSARRFEEQTVVEDVEIKDPPKSVLGKFLRWLRT